ncbi:MAG: hypothetical protein K8S16_13475, partial [Bacteroidales bacterium]|nr:hypothetical protein [Bacteroidales bacterium]
SSLKMISHVFEFPLKTLQNLLPASFMILFAFKKGSFKKAWDNDFIRFSIIIFLANFFVYLVSPGSRDRYIYMLYPFPVIFFVYFFVENYGRLKWATRTFNILIVVVICALAIAPVILLFIDNFQFLSNIYLILLFSILAAIFLLVVFFKSNNQVKPLFLIFALIGFRILFNVTVLEQRNIKSGARQNKDNAYEILNIVKDKPLYLYQNTTCSRISIFYLEKERKSVLRRKEKFTPGSYFIVSKNEKLESPDFETKLYFDDKGNTFFKLVKAL